MLNTKYELNEKLLLKDIKQVDLDNVIDSLEEKYKVDDLDIVFWEDEDCRKQGISTDGYAPVASNIEELIKEAKDLVDDWGYACVEIQNKNRLAIYFYDEEDELIVF